MNLVNRSRLWCCLFILLWWGVAGMLVSVRAGEPLTKSDRARFSYFFQEALKHKQAERYAAAYALFKHCLEIDSDSPEALFELGLFHLYLGDEANGLPRLERAIELCPDNPWYKETLASYYVNEQDVERAIPVLEDLARRDSSRTDVLTQLVALYSMNGRPEEAVRILDRIELLEGVSPQLRVEKYKLHMELKHEGAALQELESLVQENPDEAAYQVLVGSHYLKMDKPEKAREVFHLVQQKHPHESTLQFGWLDYYEHIKDEAAYTALHDSLLYGESTDEGVRARLVSYFVTENLDAEDGAGRIQALFDSVLARPQKTIEILGIYTNYLEYREASSDSIAPVLERILDIDPTHSGALLRLLLYEVKKNNLSGVADLCRMGINQHPEELAYYHYLASACMMEARPDEAFEAAQMGVRQIGESSRTEYASALYMILGDLYYEKGQVAEAFAAYDSCLVYRDDNVTCLNNYAYYLSLRKENLERAEEMSFRTLRAEPESRTYLDTYAWVLFVMERYEDARTYIDKALSLPAKPADEGDNLSTVLLEHAGDIYYKCGEVERALELWKQARDAGGASELIGKKIKYKKYVE